MREVLTCVCVIYTVDPWTIWGEEVVRGVNLYAAESPHTMFGSKVSFLHLQIQLTVHGKQYLGQKIIFHLWLVELVDVKPIDMKGWQYLLKEIFACKWTHTVPTCVVQELTVLYVHTGECIHTHMWVCACMQHWGTEVKHRSQSYTANISYKPKSGFELGYHMSKSICCVTTLCCLLHSLLVNFSPL